MPNVDALLSSDATMVNTVTRLVKISDYFMLEHLEKVISKPLEKKFNSMAKAYQTAGKRNLTNTFVTLFFDTAAVAYCSRPCSMEKVQAVFVKFFKLTGYTILLDDRFQKRLTDVPQLSNDVLISLVKRGEGIPPLIPFDKPSTCNHCGQRIGLEGLCPLNWIAEGGRGCYVAKGLCEICADLYERNPASFTNLNTH